VADRPRAPTRSAAFLWFLAAAALAVVAVLRFRGGESVWLQVAAAVLTLAVGVRFLLRSRAAGG
jgi:hypothetical protein